jgi:hypothetical protein
MYIVKNKKKMKHDQLKRFNKLSTDEFYLLDHNSISSGSEFYEFTISGSTKNVYKVKLYNSGKTFCNCPDFLGHAKRAGCVCKHVCFVLSRVLKYNDQSFYDTLTFDCEKVKDLCTCLSIDSCLINLSLTDKYIDLKDNQPNFNKYREIKEDDDCPICYMELGSGSDLCILGCPACLGAIHKKCMEKWLSNKKSCCYCRNNIWEKYGNSVILQL